MLDVFINEETEVGRESPMVSQYYHTKLRKKIQESSDIEKTRFWHREFRSLVIKINHMNELLKLDRKLEIVLFRSGIGPYAAFESV